MASFQGHRCSASWAAVLQAASKDIRFTINSAQRTMAEQQGFWDTYQRDGWPIAAYPSPTAPHIRVGRQDHALDVNADGGQTRLASWLRSRGVKVHFPVGGEPWHLEVLSENALISLAESFEKPSLDVLYKGERKIAEAYLKLAAHKTRRNLPQRVLRKTQLKVQRRQLQKLIAKHGGSARRARLRVLDLIIKGRWT